MITFELCFQLVDATKGAYSWHSLLHFFRLLYSPYLEVREFATMTLGFLLQASENRDIVYNEVGHHCGVLQCTVWSHDKYMRQCGATAIASVCIPMPMIVINSGNQKAIAVPL